MKLDKLVQVSIIFIGLVVLALVLKEMKSLLVPLFLAVLFTILIAPWLKWCTKSKGHLIASILLLVVVLGATVYSLGAIITLEAQQFNTQIPIYETQFQILSEKVSNLLAVTGNDIETSLDANSLTPMIKSVLATLTSLFSMLGLALIFTLFILPVYEKFHLKIEKKPKGRKRIKDLFFRVEKSVQDYLITKTLISLGTAFFSGIILWFFKADFVFLISLLIFILNFIPNIGSVFAVVIAVIPYLVKFGFGTNFIILLAILFALQMVFGNYLEPKFAGKKLNMSPVLILISLLVWGYIWGVIGMLLAVPLTSIIKIVLKHANIAKLKL